MMMIKKTISALLILASATLGNQVIAGPSILDLKHSITDNELVPPESFETKARELEENFYLQNYTVVDRNNRGEQFATPKVYEERLAALPTEIEMPYNDIVRRFIEMYLGKRRNQLADMLALHTYYGNIFLEELVKEGMPTELQYLPVIESALNPNAVSKAGAGGLWQFMPSTAKGMGMEVSSLVDERRDPRMSSQKAAKYLHDLYDIYGDWSLAIAAYNCGPGNVNKAIRRAGGNKKDFWEIYNYLPKETRGYVPAFIAANYVMNYHDKHGIAPTVVKKHLTTDTVQVKNRVHLRQIADVLKIPVEEIRMLNPQFRKDIIPGSNRKAYALTLPTQQCLAYVMSEDQILAHDADLYAQRTHVEPGERNNGNNKNNEVAENHENNNDDAPTVQQPSKEVAQATSPEVVQNGVRRITHTVERGENLKDVARRYGVSATDLKRWNQLRRGKVKEGDRLVVELGTTSDNSEQYAYVPERQHRQLRNTTNDNAVPLPPAKKEPAPLPAVPSVKNTKPTRVNEPVPEVPRPSRAQTDTRKTDKPRTNNTNNNDAPATQPKKKRNEQAAPEQPATTKRNTKKQNEQAAPQQQSSNKKKQGRQDTANNNNKGNKNNQSDKNNNKNNKNNKKAQQPKEPATKEYTVKKGDTLDELARKNNTTVDAIRQANGMKKNADNINIDQKLKIPKATKKDAKNNKKEDQKNSKNNKKDNGKNNSKKDNNKKDNSKKDNGKNNKKKR